MAETTPSCITEWMQEVMMDPVNTMSKPFEMDPHFKKDSHAYLRQLTLAIQTNKESNERRTHFKTHIGVLASAAILHVDIYMLYIVIYYIILYIILIWRLLQLLVLVFIMATLVTLPCRHVLSGMAS